MVCIVSLFCHSVCSAKNYNFFQKVKVLADLVKAEANLRKDFSTKKFCRHLFSVFGISCRFFLLL